MNIFGDFIRKRRKELGFSQVQFSKLVGTSKFTISVIESGTSYSAYHNSNRTFCNPLLISKIAEVLKLDPDELFILAKAVPLDVVDSIKRFKDVEQREIYRMLRSISAMWKEEKQNKGDIK